MDDKPSYLILPHFLCRIPSCTKIPDKLSPFVQSRLRLTQITARAGQAEVFQRIGTIGVNVLDVHGLPHHALGRLTILTPVLGALMHPAHRLRLGQLTHWWVAAHRG
jgi:hypothetical protein